MYFKIINGLYKGKKQYIPSYLNIRITKSIITELFLTKIKYKICNSICLDLFVGSGSISFNLLSMYINFIYMIDNNYHIINYINKIIKLYSLYNNRYCLYYIDSLYFINNTKLLFDIIILDPPFNKFNIFSLLYKCINLLLYNGIIYLELPLSSYKLINLNCFNIINYGIHSNIIFYIISK